MSDRRITRSISQATTKTDTKIPDYFTMSDSEQKKTKEPASDEIRQLRKLLEQLCQDVKTGNDRNETNFAKLGEDITEIKTTVSNHESRLQEQESEIKELRSEVKDVTDTLNDLDTEDIKQQLAEALGRIKTLEKNEMENAVHSRKYNLLIYGIDGKETDARKTENLVREFAKTDLKLEREFPIANTHRIPKRYQQSETPGPDPIVVKFLSMADRDEFLRAATNIPRDSKKRVRTHLPLSLAKERAKLARQAYSMRQEGWQARVRERTTMVWLETRKSTGDSWTKTSSVTLDDILDKKISPTTSK